MPARLTGVQRFQPAVATRSRCLGSSTWAAAPLRPTAPISEPPNQGARPKSCRERGPVLSAAMVVLLQWMSSDERGPPEELRPPPLGVVRLPLVLAAELVLVA